MNPEQQLALAKTDIPYMESDLTKKHGLFYVDANFIKNKVYPSLERGGVTGMPPAASVVDMSVLDDAYAMLKNK